ncbi:MAG: tRNA guanosine(34) transglycosylase Tgt [Alphaproteobacteria bacterium]|nr:tRNA guanosine(34) transglycosylase Tgt [Alphaproteobacteria bacterium]
MRTADAPPPARSARTLPLRAGGEQERGAGIGFTLLALDGAARRGRLTTAHGSVETPAFMPVGTQATVKAMTPAAVAATGAEIVLANAYHLMLRPGPERIAAIGGIHKFMNWPGALLTDSGGFQVMSLAELRQVTENGVVFKSHLDGSRHELTPERSMAVQEKLGVDIAMALDECVRYPASPEDTRRAMRLTIAWAERARAAFPLLPGRGLFGIVQGGVDRNLRTECARALAAISFDGFALGGLAVGEGHELMIQVVAHTTPLLPAEKPRYLMGVGKPEDIVAAVAAGIDMFDCVLPTRSGRTHQAFTRQGEINVRNARHADDPRPLDPDCACPTCQGHSRAYLHHLAKSEEMLGAMLLTWHNVHYYQELMRGLREAIVAGKLDDFRAAFAERRAQGDIPPLN